MYFLGGYLSEKASSTDADSGYDYESGCLRRQQEGRTR
jgi:hypothetical protein